MSKFYARFKPFKDEIVVFATEKERDEWVNCPDTTFDRVSVSERRAKELIRQCKLVKVETQDLYSKDVTLYMRENTRYW